MSDNEALKTTNGGLIYKAETVLKHRNKLNEIRERKAKQKLASVQIQRQAKKAPKSDIKRPEDFVRTYRESQKNYADYKKRKQRGNNNSGEPTAGDVVMVLRIRSDKNLSDQQRKLLSKLRLKKQHEAVLLRVDQPLIDILKSVENCVIYGQINYTVAKELVTKRGNLRKNKEIKSISSNEVVEDILGELGIICIEDIISSIARGNKDFDVVQKHLCTFKLSKPTEGYGDKKLPVTKSGVWGYRGNTMNELVNTMI